MIFANRVIREPLFFERSVRRNGYFFQMALNAVQVESNKFQCCYHPEFGVALSQLSSRRTYNGLHRQGFASDLQMTSLEVIPGLCDPAAPARSRPQASHNDNLDNGTRLRDCV